MPTKPSAPKSGVEARTDKHRQKHRLVQSWVSPELHAAIEARAKIEGRPIGNYIRRELGRIVGINERRADERADDE